MNGSSVDAVVIGAGIAGVAVAAELARERSVVVVEMEAAMAQHTTGRSAAAWINGYGGRSVFPFAAASRQWYESGGEGRSDAALLGSRGMLVVAEDEVDVPELDVYLENGAERVDAATAVSHFGALRPEIVHDAVWDETVKDIDVMAALGAFRRALTERGGRVQLSSPVRGIKRVASSWQVTAGSDTYAAPLVVDAAGAWADDVARMAGLAPIGLQPLRRTLCTFDEPGLHQAARWPLLLDAGEHFYMKPDGAGFMASPADEVPQAPGDPRPTMDDVAAALDQVRRFTGLQARSVRSSWAGLRTFAPDRSLVLGPDPAARGFAWSAGGGGFGIMTAPAAARSVVSLIDLGRLPDDVVAAGGRAEAVLPDRLRKKEGS